MCSAGYGRVVEDVKSDEHLDEQAFIDAFSPPTSREDRIRVSTTIAATTIFRGFRPESRR